MENKNINKHDVEEQRIALKEPLNNTALNETRDSAYSAHSAYSRGEHNKVRGEDTRWMGYMF